MCGCVGVDVGCVRACESNLMQDVGVGCECACQLSLKRRNEGTARISTLTQCACVSARVLIFGIDHTHAHTQQTLEESVD